MLPEWHNLIERLHRTSRRFVIVVTGGGASAISDLLIVPGGSHTILEGAVPYSSSALLHFLGRLPEQFCSEETALAMATVAFQKATLLKPYSENKRGCVGISCTAALVSDRPKKGDHRCFVAVETFGTTTAYSLTLEKGARDRAAEEQLVSRLILSAMASAAGLNDIPPLALRAGESVHERSAVGHPLLIEMLSGCYQWDIVSAPFPDKVIIWSTPDGTLGADQPEENARRGIRPPCGLVCGSFNPLHAGHEELRAVAERILGGPVYYEMSIRNVDKPPLDFLTIQSRCAQFKSQPVALTTASTFVGKSSLFPGITFIVGVDTAERVVEPRYYQNSPEGMRAALTQFRDRGCRFLVAGRKSDSKFVTLADVAIPQEFSNLFQALPEREFRVDISSTELRNQQ